MSSSNGYKRLKNKEVSEKIFVTYQAMINWLRKAQKHKGHKNSKLYIRNAERYYNSIIISKVDIDISDEKKLITELKKAAE